MKTVDLVLPQSMGNMREDTHLQTHHVKEDLVELGCLKPVQAEAISVLGNHVISKRSKHGQQADFRPSSWNSFNRTSNLSKFRLITGSSLRTDSLENILDIAARRLRCKS